LGRWGRVRPPNVGERGLSDGLIAEGIDSLTICALIRYTRPAVNHSPRVTKDDNLKGASAVYGDYTHDQHTFNRTFFLDAIVLDSDDIDLL
jgi:hypothetical protein